MTISDAPLLSECNVSIVAKAIYDHDREAHGYKRDWLYQDSAVREDYTGKAEAAIRAVLGLFIQDDDWGDF